MYNYEIDFLDSCVEYFQATANASLRLSFSGPSSSGKTACLSRLMLLLEQLPFSVELRPSISRTHVKAVSTTTQRSETFQQQLFDEAVSENLKMYCSNSQIQLYDRILLDGYVYVLNYGQMTASFLEQYAKAVFHEIQQLDYSILFQRAVFVDDGTRREFDKNFSDDFIRDFQKHWPCTETPLLILPKVIGIDDLYLSLLATISHHLRERLKPTQMKQLRSSVS